MPRTTPALTPAARARSAVARGWRLRQRPRAPAGAASVSRASLRQRIGQPPAGRRAGRGAAHPQRHRHHLAGRRQRVGRHPVDQPAQVRPHRRRVQHADQRLQLVVRDGTWSPRRRRARRHGREQQQVSPSRLWEGVGGRGAAAGRRRWLAPLAPALGTSRGPTPGQGATGAARRHPGRRRVPHHADLLAPVQRHQHHVARLRIAAPAARGSRTARETGTAAAPAPAGPTPCLAFDPPPPSYMIRTTPPV